MYQIFVVVDILFGEIERVVENNRDIANIIWKDFMSTNCPIITVNENKFKIWNVKQTHQPTIVKDWPEWVEQEWNNHNTSKEYLGAKLIDWDSIGCFELRHSTTKESGMKELERVFYTYKGEQLFSIIEYD